MTARAPTAPPTASSSQGGSRAINVVVVGDHDVPTLRSDLSAAGWRVTFYNHVEQVTTSPELLLIVGDDAAQSVARCRELPALSAVPKLVIYYPSSAYDAHIALAAGADDVAPSDVSTPVLLGRCRNLIRLPRSDSGMDAGVLSSALIRVNELLTQRGDEYAALVAALLVISETLRFERASLVAHIEGSENIFVIAANDAPSRSRFAVNIANYPEVALVMRGGAPVLIDDALSDARMESVRSKLVGRNVRGMALFPVQWRGRTLGVLMLRGSVVGVGHLHGRGMDLARLLASITAAHLRHGAVLESLREQTSNLSRARYEAERRLRGIHSLQEHFESGSDGVVVLDDEGRILFVNKAAERITGFDRDGLIGTELVDLIPAGHRQLIADASSQVLAGTNLDPFDLPIGESTAGPVWVSVSTSTVLAQSGAVIFMFRDVSQERSLAHELGATKEFLERLIDSTVDAIIAADMRGNLVLFNQGAERLFGYQAQEAIGRIHVSDLYDAAVAQQIMKMLRATSFGGVGRLEQTRRQIRSSTGEMVPVSLTASIVYDGDVEVASVGIITDLRDRIRMEQRLLDAQQKLQLSERQAIVAELAGAAAHELNQPLTSIMGYAQLILRQSDNAAPHVRGVNIIFTEAERMAALVRKIGRITKYETREYVGSTRIFDLDLASEDSSPSMPVQAQVQGTDDSSRRELPAQPDENQDLPMKDDFDELTGEFQYHLPGDKRPGQG
jgi:PAS domain S-box-containing protein